MKNQITIREAITEAEAAAFWEQLHIYFLRDIFPDPKDEDREYFLGDEYRDAICKVHGRPGDSPGVRKTVKPICECSQVGFLYVALARQHPRLPCVKGAVSEAD